MINESLENEALPRSVLIPRAIMGGILMGLANLVPGISGGTMLLAAGIYPLFITAVAEITTLKFRFRSLLVLACVAGSAAVAILGLAGIVKDLVVDHRWVMYSLFIGLTLGGVPVIWKMAKSSSPALKVGAVVGFALMAALAYVQQMGLGTSQEGAAGLVMLFVAGLAGASAMILPGISGGYLLLVLGQYVPILSAIHDFKEALQAGAFDSVFHIGLTVCLPIGLGVVIGMAVVSNLLKYFLQHHEKATLGMLLGLLLGAVVGLWPFQNGVQPHVGDRVKGQVMTEELIEALDVEDYPTVFFNPTGAQVGVAAGLIIVGFLGTLGIAHIGSRKPPVKD